MKTVDMSERIKSRRIQMGLTQEELGEKLGLQKSAIAKYENGRVENIKRSVISNMAKVLDCSPCYLMGWEEQREKTNPKIIDYYNQLNDIGRHEATKRVEELTYIPQYRAGSEPLLNAAHEIAGASEADQQHDDDIMNDDDF